MSRSARIAEIIDKRKPLAQRIETAIGNLEALRGALKSIETKRKGLLPKLKDEAARDQLEKIDFVSPHDAITAQLVHLEKLEARFSRKTLNIGVIGMMRQGKSTLLQSLTGLDNSVIPAKSGGVCTAVRSKIHHQQHGETQAVVSFHSESSFVTEVLKPYYNDLELTPVPHTLADFIYSDLPSLNLESTNKQKAIYNRFVDDYHKNRHSFQKYLKSTEVREAVAIDKIQEYVTHLHSEQGDEQYKYLAVKEVEISCAFLNDDVGKITVVDIPGLGDFKSSDRQLMLETLGKEVDVILLIRRPDVIGDDLYQFFVKVSLILY